VAKPTREEFLAAYAKAKAIVADQLMPLLKKYDIECWIMVGLHCWCGAGGPYLTLVQACASKDSANKNLALARVVPGVTEAQGMIVAGTIAMHRIPLVAQAQKGIKERYREQPTKLEGSEADA